MSSAGGGFNPAQGWFILKKSWKCVMEQKRPLKDPIYIKKPYPVTSKKRIPLVIMKSDL